MFTHPTYLNAEVESHTWPPFETICTACGSRFVRHVYPKIGNKMACPTPEPNKPISWILTSQEK